MVEETMVFPLDSEAGENQELAEERLEQQKAQQARESVLKRQFYQRLQAKKLEKAKGALEKIAGVDSLVAKVKQAKQLVSFLKLGSAATVVGILITFLVMNLQLILWGVKGLPFNGFWSGKLKLPLSLAEFIILLVVWFVVFAIIILIVALVYLNAECNLFEKAGLLLGISDCF